MTRIMLGNDAPDEKPFCGFFYNRREPVGVPENSNPPKPEKLHLQKIDDNGTLVGTCVEYPGIIVSGKTDAELVENFRKALPVHLAALGKKHTRKIEVIGVTFP